MKHKSKRVCSQCRERVKKATKLMGVLYYDFGSVHACNAFWYFRRAVEQDAKLVNVSTDDMYRWFTAASVKGASND